MVTVVAYARVSTDRQTEKQTIAQQIDRLQTYAQQHQWQLTTEQIYKDDGYSGARLDRPALDRLRDAAANGAVDVVLITSPDRLARRYAYQVWLLEELERADVQVIFLERPPTGDPQDVLVIQIRGVVAEYERTVIADRMRRGRLAALRAGQLVPWTVPPFGYRQDPHRPRDPAGLQLDEDAAHVVRQIFTWYIEDGLTLYGIAQRLIDRGIPTPSGRPYWNPSSVRKILMNATYRGMAYGNQKQMVPAKRRHPLLGREPRGEGGESYRLRPVDEWIGVPVPSLIEDARFALAQARLQRNQQWATRNTRGEYLLRRLLSCRWCGLAMNVWNNGRYAYYRCKGMDVLAMRGRREPCHARQIPTARIDDLVWDDLRQLLSEPVVLHDAVQRFREGWLSGEERQAHRRDLRRRRAQIKRRIERLVDAYQAEALTLEELQTRRVQLEARLAELQHDEQVLEAETVQREHLQNVATRVEDFRAAISEGIEHADFNQRRALVELLIDRVVVDGSDVEIRYVIPLSGAARRKGVLRPRYRTPQQGDQTANGRGRHLSESSCGDPLGGCRTGRTA
jgi:site-specific DNA recombinase